MGEPLDVLLRRWADGFRHAADNRHCHLDPETARLTAARFDEAAEEIERLRDRELETRGEYESRLAVARRAYDDCREAVEVEYGRRLEAEAAVERLRAACRHARDYFRAQEGVYKPNLGPGDCDRADTFAQHAEVMEAALGGPTGATSRAADGADGP
jgi:hypothetical protein